MHQGHVVRKVTVRQHTRITGFPSRTRKGQRAVCPFIKGNTKICHFLIVINKETNLNRYILNWFIYNNSNANKAGISFRPFKFAIKFLNDHLNFLRKFLGFFSYFSLSVYNRTILFLRNMNVSRTFSNELNMGDIF
jgi:hypothetical protein